LFRSHVPDLQGTFLSLGGPDERGAGHASELGQELPASRPHLSSRARAARSVAKRGENGQGTKQAHCRRVRCRARIRRRAGSPKRCPNGSCARVESSPVEERMKTRAIAIGCFAGLLMLVAAPGSPAGEADQPARGGPDIQSAQTEAYNGPKARIAVAD